MRNKLAIIYYFQKSFLIILTILCFSQIASADSVVRVETLDEQTSLEGTWKIDARRIPVDASHHYDDSKWENIHLPGYFGKYALTRAAQEKTADGIFWVRKKIFFSEDLKRENVGIILGRIANADETYFNGVKIGGLGKFPPGEFSMWNHPRHYSIPKEIIKYGEENILSIKVYSFVFSEILGTMAITNENDLYIDKVIQNFIYITLNYIIIFIGALLYFIFFVIFIIRRESEYLYYALQLSFGLFIVLELCIYFDIYGGTLNRLKILAFSWAAINVVHPIFLHRFYSFRRKKIEIALWSYLAISAIFLLSVKGVISDLPSVRVFIFATTLIGGYNMSCHISAVIKRRPYSKLYIVFFITVIIGAIHDGISYLSKFLFYQISLFGYSFETMIFGYSAAAFFIGSATVLVIRLLNSMEEVLDLYSALEGYVVENALLYNKANKTNGKKSPNEITNKSEEKMKKIMEFISDNYKFDISREGLAASIDMHPDSLSRIFKRYTQKRLGDYIHELRINDAIEKLMGTEDKIIDIAYDVGFDCLRTFNRAFRKCKDMSPEKYRNLNRN